MQPSDPQFRVPPFPAFPSVTRYVALGSTADTLSRISRSIEAREGVSLVIGPPGTGKSLLCALIVDEYRDTHDVVVLGETPIEDQSAFLRHLLHHLGADFESIPERDLQLSLIDRVCDPQSPAGGLLIVVDEAQAMSCEVLESIRMVTNIMRDGEPRVYAVVCGGVKLDETLSTPSMEAFTQRVATRCYLHPLNGEETRHYISETITRCGAEPEETITEEAIAAIHHACNGVPRLLNQMLTQAIDCAEEADKSLITEQLVDQAWAELQQLPSPMVEEPSLARNSSTIEFGELEELDDRIGPAHSEATDTYAVEHGELSSDDVKDSCRPVCDATQCTPENCDLDDCQDGKCSATQSQTPHELISNSSDDNQDDEVEAVSIEMSDDNHGELEPRDNTTLCVTGSEGAPSDRADQHHGMTETMVQSSALLFGEFEEEEEVVVGSGVTPSRPQNSQSTTHDLESILHQEIVSIANDAALQVAVNSGQTQVDHQTAIDDLEDNSPIHPIQRDIEIDVDDCQLENEPQTESDETSQPVLWINESSGVDQSCDDDQDMLICDDQDMLVIEDDLELTSIPIQTRIDAEEQTVSVDFQAMLARMRSGV